MTPPPYALQRDAAELERLDVQAAVWEAAGRRLLDRIGRGDGARVLDVGCGPVGWLRTLSDWVGPDGQVVGTDIDDGTLNVAGRLVTEHGLGNVTLIRDDLFDSQLEPSWFDLVHARFLIGPLGRGHEQMQAHHRLVRPGGTVILEELDPLSWHFVPAAPALGIDPDTSLDRQLIPLIGRALRAAGGDDRAFATQLAAFQRAGMEPAIHAEVQALPPGHPYLRLPLDMATALDPVLRTIVGSDDLDTIVKQAETELADPNRWGITFTLTQCWGRRQS